jgi:hypothetical protein
MKGLQRFIIGIYRFLGLLSIPALTVVTTISMANLFTAGHAAQWDNISVIWAWVYAAAIETNVIRLFTEKRKASFALGLGLGVVTCIALQFEGMQQTGSMMWNNPTVQMLLPWIIALRSILVYVLIAYEGRRLVSSEQNVSAQPTRLTVLKNVLIDRAIERVVPSAQIESTEQPKQIEQPQSKQSAKLHVVKVIQDTAPLERVKRVLIEHPDCSDRKLAKLTDLAPATAKKYRQLSTAQSERVATGGQ